VVIVERLRGSRESDFSSRRRFLDVAAMAWARRVPKCVILVGNWAFCGFFFKKPENNFALTERVKTKF